MKARNIPTKAKHMELIHDIVATIRKYEPEMDKVEMLAVLANVVGKVIAMQDQRKYSTAAIMEILSRNIEIGNKEAIDELWNSAAGQA